MSVSSEGAASKTAIMVAAYRGLYSARPDAACRDPWAAALAGDEGRAIARAFEARFPHMELWTGMRTAFLDELVARQMADGVRQIVLLGAGLDTRAARLATPGVQFFEVDHPATQADKRRRLAALDGYPVDAATYAPCDFETDDFLDRLAAVDFDAAAAALIVWEGVVPYLTEPAVRATLRRVATGCHPDTALAFDYLMKRMVYGDDIPEHDKQTRQLVSDLGEPVTFGTNDPLPMLVDEGFRHVRSISFDEITLDYTGTYDRARMFRFQHLALASVARRISS